MSSSPSNFVALIRDYTTRVSRTQTVIAASALLLGLPVIRRIRADYLRWLSMGRGGVPHNFLGYVLVCYLTAKGDFDVDSTVRYVREGRASELERTSFLHEPIPIRTGSRPHITKWAAPVRQLSAMSSEDITQKLLTAMLTLASKSSSSVTWVPSKIEGGSYTPNALLLTTSAPKAEARRFATRGVDEVYHVHPTDGSAHCIVSAADAKILIEAGWSERHPLSGVDGLGFPSTYIHLYAPRSEDEIAVHEAVARAAIGYALGKAL